MKKPSFQFYPGDWRKDQNLSRASLAAKGALIEILCLAFECEKRGYLKTGKEPWSIDEIAHAIGGDKMQNILAIEELLNKKIIKKDKKNAIFSARMVRDEKLSKIRRKAGLLGGNKILLNQNGSKPPPPSSSSSTSVKKESIEKETKELPKNSNSSPLAGSNLFRKPKIPTKQEVMEVFTREGGTKEMAASFWKKHDSTGWFLNGSPIMNFASLASRFITNWNKNEEKNSPEISGAPTLKRV